MATAYTESQYFTTTLSKVGGLNASQTTGIVLQSVSGIFDTTKPGVALLNYSDPISTTVAEWVTFTSINSTTKTLVGVTRGAEGFSAKTHDNGVTIAFPHSKSHINNLAAALAIGGSYTNIPTGVLDEDDMASNSAVKLATQQSIKAYVDANAGTTTGWTTVSDTWVYASASTFTISGVDRTTVYTKGTKLKFTQTTAKYAVVVSSSFSTDTTVTIAVNTDYTIANAAITSPFYSYQENPQGYPTRFNFTPSWTNLTVGSGSIPYAFYSVRGDRVYVQVKFIFGSGSSIGGPIYLAAPVAFTTITGIADQDAMMSACLMLDSGTALYTGGCQYDIANSRIEARPFDASTTYAKYVAASSTVPMTWTTSDALTMVFMYQI